MWVLTPDGGTLISVVKFDPKKAPSMAKKHGAADTDQDYLLVRARVPQSLEYVADVLDALYKGEVEGYQRPIVDADPKADYKYRTIITPSEWKAYLAYEVDGIDYSSHVKEETVRRQPEPKIANLYSALSKTWGAWSKLQDTPPYFGSWKAKPDCKNCPHTELSHSIKGDQCNHGRVWAGGKETFPAGRCACTKYEPKPAAKAPAKAGAGTQLELPAGEVDPTAPVVIDYSVEGTGYYPETIWEGVDAALGVDDSEEGALAALEGTHPDWCTWWDGERCICTDDEERLESEYPGLVAQALALEMKEEVKEEVVDGGLIINDLFVAQEPPVAGESKQAKKNRLERNRRARRRARRVTRQAG